MDADDKRILVSKNLSVEALQNYFALKPMPTRRELAELKRYVARYRYNQWSGESNALLDETSIPTRSKWVGLYS